MGKRFRIIGSWNENDYEDPEEVYKKGGMKPFVQGDWVDNVQIAQKLGSGGSCHVWLAGNAERYVVIKVVKASYPTEMITREIKVLERLTTPENKIQAESLLVLPTFVGHLRSPNGTHVTSTFPSWAHLYTTRHG
jgi:serine/threonine protein kinase